jgi:hypothetical protein
MKRIITIAFMAAALTVAAPHTTLKADTGVGTWKAYMSYHTVKKVVKHGGVLYVLASGDLYTYNTADNSIETFDTTNLLSDCGIADIEWCDAANRLIVLYNDGNIDILDKDLNCTNLPDYADKMLTVDKTVNQLCVSGTRAYLATNFGIVVINVQNATITDTYNLGQQVASVTLGGGNIYAATPQGIIKGSLADNLTDKSQWTTVAEKSFKWIFFRNGHIEGLNNGELYTVSADDGTMEFVTKVWLTKAYVSGDRIICTGAQNLTYIYNTPTDYTLVRKTFTGLGYDPQTDTYWGPADDDLLCNMKIERTSGIEGTTTQLSSGIATDGPKYNYFGFMRYMNGMLYTGGGQSSPEREACIQILDGNDWTVYDDSFASSIKGNYRSTYCVDLDPADPTHLYAGTQAGMFEFRDGKMTQQYTIDNAPFTAATTSSPYNYTLITALKATSDGSVWCFNSNAKDGSTSLLQLKDGQWTSHHSSAFVDSEGSSMRYVRSMMVDSRGLLWFVNNEWRLPALVSYNMQTGESHVYDTFVNEDGTTVDAGAVTCATEDKSGNIWIGTIGGPLMLTADAITSGSETFEQVKVPRNDGTNLADYLLNDVYTTAVCVDGAGRKWFGTSGNGVYLISADNLEQLQHFTTSNSPLLSDIIESISVNDKTGEVFFGTDNGLCSYMGDATEAAEEMTKDNVYAYPNPVEPGYDGLITIVGLTLDADIKIVGPAGTLVKSGRSNGGTFTWDGCDLHGNPVVSGIYMVETATSDGKKGTVCRIAIVR